MLAQLLMRSLDKIFVYNFSTPSMLVLTVILKLNGVYGVLCFSHGTHSLGFLKLCLAKQFTIFHKICYPL
jgi:hypothetical protein